MNDSNTVDPYADYQEPSSSEPDVPRQDPSYVKELLLAPIRGVESDVRNVYGLIDTLSGDRLPDWKHNFSGESETMPGKIVEGVSSFLAGFIPIAGQVGKIGTALKYTSKFARIGQVAAAGAMTDFLTMDGHQERLSNLIQEHPALANPISGYLAADKNDGEIEGRLKGALEGAGVGAMTDGLISVLKGMKTYRAYTQGMAMGAAERRSFGQTVVDEMGKSAEEALQTHSTSLVTKDAAAADLEAMPKDETVTVPKSEYDHLRASHDEIASTLANFDPETAVGGRGYQHAKEPPVFVSQHLDTPDDIMQVLSKTEKLYDEKLGYATKETQAALQTKASADLSDSFGVDLHTLYGNYEGELALFQKGQWASYGLRNLLQMVNDEFVHFSRMFTDPNALLDASKVGAFAGKDITKEKAALMALKAADTYGQLVRLDQGFGTVAARALRQRRMVPNLMGINPQFASELLSKAGGSDLVGAELKRAVAAYDANIAKGMNPVEAAGAVSKLATGTSLGGRLFKMHNEIWINSVLSGTKTAVVNLIGNASATLYEPIEMAIGSAAMGDTAGMQAGLKHIQHLSHSVVEAIEFAKSCLPGAAPLSERDNVFQAAATAFKNKENLLSPDTAFVRDFKAKPEGPYFQAGTFGGPQTTESIRGDASLALNAAKNFEGKNMLWHGVNFLGDVWRMPSRVLTTSDEFFKQLNYRAAAKTELYYRGKLRGLSGELLDQYVGDNFSKLITNGGSLFSESAVHAEACKAAESAGMKLGTADASKFVNQYMQENYSKVASALGANEDVTKLAQGVADETTFQRELGALGKGVQQLSSSHPAFQLLLPFVKTPTNLVKYYAQRGMGGPMAFMPGFERLQARNIAELTSEDALVRNKAAGRIAGGLLLTTGGIMAALNGRITGGGPKDENAKQAWLQAGNQPYSIKFQQPDGSTKFVSYSRVDPFGTFMSVVADWAEVAKEQKIKDPNYLNRLYHCIATSVSNNITSKTYLASLGQTIAFLNDPDRYGDKFMRNRLASYVPSFSNSLRDTQDSFDPDGTMKEVRTTMDAIRNRMPFMFGDLESKRNVLGQPIESQLHETPFRAVNPFTISTSKNDPVMQEMANVGKGFSAPSTMAFGVDLTADKHRTESGRTAYDRWQELTGQVSIGGKTLHDQLEKVISSSQYQKLPSYSDAGEYNSPRVNILRSVISSYRSKAMQQLQRELPALKQSISDHNAASIGVRRGMNAQQINQMLAERHAQ